MDLKDLRTGMRVIWKNKASGGYGFVIRIHATVKKVTEQRVTIVPDRADGTFGRPVSVRPENLEELRQGFVAEIEGKDGTR